LSHVEARGSVPKAERVAEFFRRLADLPPQANQLSAREALDRTLNAVEDDLSGVPFDPDRWRTDGRMYPVRDDNAADIEGHLGVLALRSRGHETFVGPNGAIEIRESSTDKVVFAKAGSDGKGVWV
jgi:hypothetical protein